MLDNYDDDYYCDIESLSSFESVEDFVHSISSSEDDSRRIRRREENGTKTNFFHLPPMKGAASIKHFCSIVVPLLFTLAWH
ncbi:hypothetical protein TNCV_770831 [Trichonephila clavipes]|nr:hypothetical protein TNCV_770831 [Trichonephila clavipes]